MASCCGRRWRGLRAFHSTRAVMSALTSNVCGNSFWPGTLWTLVPWATTALAGAPAAVSTTKARYALAATPGPSS